jgi:lipopolysaccharide/colanic/teichoic acid biosynthesis glycosyltransferase
MQTSNSLAAITLRESMKGSAPETNWSFSDGKRVFDLLITVPLILLSLPLMVVAAILLKATSPGPVLFRQYRVGRDGRDFVLFKFRTMVHNAASFGPGVTQRADRRIFPAGRWLRKWKLDELPQLFNVVCGNMSLVGPRPDLAQYLATLTEEQRAILRFRPGITGAATLRFRHEENLLAQVPAKDLGSFYTSRILPEKVQMDLEYARHATLRSDLGILFRTVAAIFA